MKEQFISVSRFHAPGAPSFIPLMHAPHAGFILLMLMLQLPAWSGRIVRLATHPSSVSYPNLLTTNLCTIPECMDLLSNAESGNCACSTVATRQVSSFSIVLIQRSPHLLLCFTGAKPSWPWEREWVHYQLNVVSQRFWTYLPVDKSNKRTKD
jgi:hypothetical protein